MIELNKRGPMSINTTQYFHFILTEVGSRCFICGYQENLEANFT